MNKRRYNGRLLFHTGRAGRYWLSRIESHFKRIGIFVNTHLPVCGADTENIRNKIQEMNVGHKLVKVGIIRDISNLSPAGKLILFHGYSVIRDCATVILLLYIIKHSCRQKCPSKYNIFMISTPEESISAISSEYPGFRYGSNSWKHCKPMQPSARHTPKAPYIL